MCNLSVWTLMTRRILFLSMMGLCVVACGETADVEMTPLLLPTDIGMVQDLEVEDPQTDMAVPAEVPSGRFKLLDPATGRGVSNVTVSMGSQAALTDSQGEAELTIPEGQYAVRMVKAGVRVHTIYGVSAGMDFQQVTYFSSEQITRLVFGSLGIQDDPTAGTVVVGLDLPNLAPAVGASAALDADSSPPFVLTQSGAVAGNQINRGQLGFVSFPNVAAGPVAVTVTFPTGQCAVFPAESGVEQMIVAAGEVSIVAYTCR
jgi:hypothetical protein